MKFRKFNKSIKRTGKMDDLYYLPDDDDDDVIVLGSRKEEGSMVSAF